MLLFLDTEFTGFIDCELISIGMTSEDGLHEFYAEVEDFSRDKCSDFVRSAVWSVLGQIEGASVKRAELGAALRTWFTELAVPLTIACDYSADWDLLVDALDGELPGNVIGRLDLANMAESAAFKLAAAGWHAGPGRPWHHALHDARANCVGWRAWTCANLQTLIPPTDRRGRRTHVEIEDIPMPYRDEFTAWLAMKPKRWQEAPAASAVRRSEWREWLILRFSA